MPECVRCDRWFNTQRALEQHQDTSSRHHICWPCNKDFPTAQGLHEHYVQSPRHAFFRFCDEHFEDNQELNDHYQEEHWPCGACNLIFNNERGQHEHRRQSHADRYCVPCKRIFQNANNLRQHQNSSTHRERSIVCPMKGCSRAFVSTAALVLHLESGTCTSGMTRAMVDQLISKLDRGGVITNPARMIAGPNSSSPRVTDQWATNRAWNGHAFECYLCHRTFSSLTALNAHLRSPAHDDKFYRCPNAWKGCGQEFRTLSAFLQHFESGRCEVYRFRSQMDRFVEGLSKGAMRLTYY
ncbi:hypothetical protein L227DRAFT_543513 [Lentinus tigrinus ALCF2SS1-6]|uniref:C2H2-type domain-containing protein n=1 Tax=Lentinus tigrinus ALCF2SS1-6 TaxID=1328759 RepID=A0A5C2SIC8_9APHY|nr:hypothetical protein L227DRAFT_543513 [Lentinus tigrinus ALCF2SS1-6]